MKVNIYVATKKQKVIAYNPNESLWATVAKKRGFKLVTQSSTEEKGQTLRTFPAFDDPELSHPVMNPEVIQLKKYNLKAFLETDAEIPESPIRFDALFFWDDEDVGYPAIVFLDNKGERVAFADPEKKDIYIHNFADKTLNIKTKEMITELLSIAGEIMDVSIKAEKKEKKERPPFQYGVDPEFLLFSTFEKKTVSANNVLSPLGYDNQSAIGFDGHSFTGEIRSKAFPTPEGVVGDVRNILKELRGICDEKRLDIVAGGGTDYKKPLGGHIHISPIGHDEELLKAFDVFIGKPLSMMKGGTRPGLTTEELRNIGSQDGYGRLSHYVNQNYAKGVMGLEYKTPPSFMTLPSLMLGALKVAQIIVERGWDGDEIPDIFDRKNVIALARTKHERIVLKRYLFYLTYGDLQSDVFENWLVRESCLQARITIHDRTGSLNVVKLRRAVVRNYKEKVYQCKTRKIFIITDGKLWNNHYLKIKPQKALVDQIGGKL